MKTLFGEAKLGKDSPPVSSPPPIDYRIVPGGFLNPVVSVGVCYTAVDAAAGGLTTEWWAVVLECFSSHPLPLPTGICSLRWANPRFR